MYPLENVDILIIFWSKLYQNKKHSSSSTMGILGYRMTDTWNNYHLQDSNASSPTNINNDQFSKKFYFQCKYNDQVPVLDIWTPSPKFCHLTNSKQCFIYICLLYRPMKYHVWLWMTYGRSCTRTHTCFYLGTQWMKTWILLKVLKRMQ